MGQWDDRALEKCERHELRVRGRGTYLLLPKQLAPFSSRSETMFTLPECGRAARVRAPVFRRFWSQAVISAVLPLAALAPALADDNDKDVQSGWNHDFYQAHTLVSNGAVPADHP